MRPPRVLKPVNSALKTLRGSTPRLVLWALAVAFMLTAVALMTVINNAVVSLLPLGAAAFVGIVLTIDVARSGLQD